MRALRHLGVLAGAGNGLDQGVDRLCAGVNGFSEGLLACNTPAALLFVDTKGEVTLSLAATMRRYDCPYGFKDGLCVIGVQEYRGELTDSAVERAPAAIPGGDLPSLAPDPHPFQFPDTAHQGETTEARPPLAGRTVSEKPYRYGLIERSGRFLVEPVYESITPRPSVGYIVSQDGMLGALNTAGKVVAPPSLRQVEFWGDLVRIVVGTDVRWVDPADGRVLFAVHKGPVP
jgi:hypothetical protein